MFHPNGPTFLELARQAMSSTQRGYDLLAPKFDFTPFRTPDAILEKVSEHLKSIAPLESCLDICCGTGAGIEMLRPYCDGRIVGVDFSQGMLDQAALNLKPGESKPSIKLVHCNVLELPCENEFDLAVCFGALGHFLPKDQEILLDQVTKVLRPGGRFIFVTHYMPGIFTPAHLLSRGFNWSMRVRNFFYRPKFIMYYLTFLLPQVRQQLEARGFTVAEHSPYTGRLKPLRLVDAVLKK